MSIYFQKLASIQPRTSLVKLARSPRTDPPGASNGLEELRLEELPSANEVVAKGLEELRNLFESLDKDHDGRVTGQERGKKVKENRTLLAKYFGGSTLKEIGSTFKRILGCK